MQGTSDSELDHEIWIDQKRKVAGNCAVNKEADSGTGRRTTEGGEEAAPHRGFVHEWSGEGQHCCQNQEGPVGMLVWREREGRLLRSY